MRNKAVACLGLGLLMISAADLCAQTRTAEAASYIQRGDDWHRKGDLDRAIADYTLALQFDPKSARAYFSRGLARHERGELEKALEDYNKSVDVNPHNANAYLNRGNLYATLHDND